MIKVSKSAAQRAKPEMETGYKKTKLGWIPEEWDFVRLRNVTNIDPESLGAKTDENYAFRYVSLSDINNGVISAHLATYTYKDSPSRAKRVVAKDDVLLATVRPNLKAFAIVTEADNLIVSTGFAVLRSNKYRLDPRFLLHSIYGVSIEKQIYGLVVGSNYPAISSKDVGNLRVILPPLPEQRAIARILSTWDCAIDRLQKLIAKKQERKKGLMQQLLSGKKRFAGFEGEWQEVRLGDICNMQAGKFVRASEIKEKCVDDLFPCYGGNGLRGFTKSYTHSGRYSLIGRQGALCGNVNLVVGQFHATEHAVVVAPKDRTETDWLHYVLIRLNLNQYATGQAQPGLSVANLEMVELKIPKNRNEQQKIASVLSAADREIEKLQGQLEKLQEQKKGLMQKLLTGEVRVKTMAAD